MLLDPSTQHSALANEHYNANEKYLSQYKNMQLFTLNGQINKIGHETNAR